RAVGGRDPGARGKGHRPYSRRQGRDPRPHLRPGDVHAHQNGHRRHPPGRTRLRRAPRHRRGGPRPGADDFGRRGDSAVVYRSSARPTNCSRSVTETTALNDNDWWRAMSFSVANGLKARETRGIDTLFSAAPGDSTSVSAVGIFDMFEIIKVFIEQ